ncbi:hypothetical protein KEM56_003805 [Ascosphaera pollenicola]|nr:hypothetical protein KEM56_003805 [Ascosphaera pollenicola]
MPDPAALVFAEGERIRRIPDYSDLTIECRGMKFSTHRFVVCSQSDVLKTAIDAQNAGNGATAVYNLDQFERRTVMSVLEYLYTGFDTIAVKTAPAERSATATLLDEAKIALLANFLNLFILKSRVIDMIRKNLDPARRPQEFIEVVRYLADKAVFADLKELARMVIPDNPAALWTFLAYNDYENLDLHRPLCVGILERLRQSSTSH